MQYPQWATPERRLYLAYRLATLLAEDMGGFELDLLSLNITHPEFDKMCQDTIPDWIAEDRAEREALWRVEQARMHQDERRIHQGRFDTVAREVFKASQPLYYLEGFTVDALTHKRVAKVRIASSSVRLWVVIPSRNAMRKAKRYGKEGAPSINEAITQAVDDYKKS